MDVLPDYMFLLVCAGLLAGFVAGLVGVGGGVIFAPVLFFYFSHVGMDPAMLAPLTIGSSLFCTCLVSISAARSQYVRSSVEWRSAVGAGMTAAVAIFLMTRFVTTKSFYDARIFQIVFSVLLVFVTLRMSGLLGREKPNPSDEGDVHRTDLMHLSVVGTTAGVVSTAVGVGGGIVMVPMYERYMHMPIHRAVGTSSATIVLISFWGVAGYILSGWGLHLRSSSFGYVDVGTALFLAIPALLTAGLGVKASHAVNKMLLRRIFAGLSAVVAARLLVRVFFVI